jgi:alanine dehydrogenase
MRIGVPKEIKGGENRVGLGPNSVRELILHGHEVLVEHNAGIGIDFDDEIYRAAGAKIVETAAEVYATAEMIVKVKEPQPAEYKLLKEGQILFAYLHLAPDPQQTEGLLKSGCIAIAYETVTDAAGGLPLLMPMSEIAGCLAIQAGGHALEKAQGGRGILLGGVPGVEKGHVVVIGGGVVGTNAIRMAVGLEARVTVLDRSLARLKELDLQFGANLSTIFASQGALEHYVTQADMVVGAVLVAGKSAPKLIQRDLLKQMRPGSVLVDVSIDQGGCFATSRPTTHAEPTFVLDGIVHYCVTNMPGAVPRTATFALTNATLPYIITIANKGYRQALLEDPHLLAGLNVYRGQITYKAVADDLHQPYISAAEALL